MPLINRCGGGSSFAAIIQVTYNSGAVCTCANGSTTLTAPDTSGSVNFKVKRAGAWTVSVSKNGQTSTVTVNVSEDGSVTKVSRTSYKVFGISRDITKSSPSWARTDDAVGFTATASVGTVAGSSSFDNCYPWNGIVRETLSTGDVMVKIPRFWYRRYRSGNVEYIKIATDAANDISSYQGFALHPAFNHANVPKDRIYVGAYTGSTGRKSISGVAPLLNEAKQTVRPAVQAKGTGWNIMDISTLSAIQMLILVEFATNNVQAAIGRGNCDNTSQVTLKTGTCDNVPHLTGRPAGTNGKTDVVWRGIEGLWGNVDEWLDGCTKNTNASGYARGWFVCNDPSMYGEDWNKDGLLTNYTKLSEEAPQWPSYTYFTKMCLDSNNTHILLPYTGNTGSATTFFCDAVSYGASFDVGLIYGGSAANGDQAGTFSMSTITTSAQGNKHSDCGFRMIYIPQEAAS